VQRGAVARRAVRVRRDPGHEARARRVLRREEVAVAAQRRLQLAPDEREEALAKRGVVAAERGAREGVQLGRRRQQPVELPDHEIGHQPRRRVALGEPQRSASIWSST
jgi:hypothetical protein